MIFLEESDGLEVFFSSSSSVKEAAFFFSSTCTGAGLDSSVFAAESLALLLYLLLSVPTLFLAGSSGFSAFFFSSNSVKVVEGAALGLVRM